MLNRHFLITEMKTFWRRPLTLKQKRKFALDLACDIFIDLVALKNKYLILLCAWQGGFRGVLVIDVAVGIKIRRL